MFNQIIALALILLLAPLSGKANAFPSLLAISLPGGNRTVTPPPQPIAANIKIKIGESAKIPLAIYGQANSDVSFVIRNPPRYGKLSDIRTDESGGSYVVYKHNGNPAATADRFFYAARSVDGVSAAVPVTIAISDDAPNFEAPQTLDFDNALVGKTVTRKIQIANSGGGKIDGEVAVGIPWKIIGDTRYSLARKGGARTITLSVTPDHPGILRAELRYTNDLQHPTELSVHAIPIFAAPESIDLLASGTNKDMRSASLKISNATNDDLTIKISAPQDLGAPAQIVVPANSDRAFPLHAGGLGEIAESLSLTANDYTQTVAVRAAAEPAQLQASATNLDFGNATLNTSDSKTITLKNNGGATADVSLSTGAPFAIAEKDAQFPLAGGASREIAVSGSFGALGNSQAMLKIHTVTQDLQIPLTANVAAAAILPQNPFDSKSKNVLESASKKASDGIANGELSDENGAAISDFHFAPPLSVLNFRVKEIGSHRCVFTWKQPPKNAAGDFHIERANPRIDTNGNFALDWISLTDVKIQNQNGEMIATVNGLDAKKVYVLRLTGAVAGEAPRSTMGVRIPTTSAWTPLQLFTPLRALVLVFIVFCTILIRQKLRERRM